MHQNKNQNKNILHEPVLINQVVKILNPKKGERYLDLTAGYGGHASVIIGLTGNPSGSVLVDRDPNAIKRLHERFKEDIPRTLNLDFFAASKELIDEGEQYDLILADLGVSSPHLNEGNRGFSFQQDGPLDMRMDPRQDLTAEWIVNKYSSDEIATILSEYGEEPKAKKIASEIVKNRPISSTEELSDLVSRIWKGYSRTHPATRTFQALRIVVNDELSQIEHSLPLWQKLLSPNGRLAIISFHSLEDRIVKRFFKEQAGEYYDSELRSLTPKPVTAEPEEIVHNPRARSAKLRAVVKIKI